MSAPRKLCGFDLLPLQDFHLMVSWVPPGITSPLKRHFAFCLIRKITSTTKPHMSVFLNLSLYPAPGRQKIVERQDNLSDIRRSRQRPE
jgi:hypothetical protein